MTSVFADEAPDLLQKHFEHLHLASGIATEAILERGYRSILGHKELADLHYSKSQQRLTPGILIPLFAPDGSPAGSQYRPDSPRLDAQGRPIKYETPAGGSVRLDVPPRFRAAIADPAIPLYFTEGAKKADAAASHGLACVNLSGVWGFKGANLFGAVTLLADFDSIALDGRTCIIAYDSDIIDKRPVQQAMERLAEHLHRKGASVYVARLPGGEGDKKVGLDDYLLTRSAADLESLRQRVEVNRSAERGYECSAAGLGYLDDDGEFHLIVPVPTTIATMEYEAEGDAAAIYTLALQLPDGQRLLRVTANDLADQRTMRAAFLAHGVALAPRRELFLAPALIATSGNYPKIRIYHRIGWAGGVYVAPGREPESARVRLPNNVYVRMGGGDMAEAMVAVNALMTAMPPEQMTILLTHAFLAPLARPADLDRYKYGLHLAGRTGSLKTSVASCVMALWAGPEWVMEPASKLGEGATNNAIMALAYHHADGLYLIDNYKPSTGGGSKAFVALLHNILEGADRLRLDRTSRLREPRPLHTWPLTTGEDIPTQDAASMARLLVLPFAWEEGKHNEALSRCQAHAAALPALMGAWLDWIESNGDALKRLGGELAERRQRWGGWIMKHRPKAINALRLATNLALQEIGWQAMSRCPALTAITDRYSASHRRGLEAIALEMGEGTAESVEATQWLNALSDVLATGEGYLRSVNGDMPRSPSDKAKLIGWCDDDCAYLLPTPTHGMVYEALRRGGQQLLISTAALYKQLDQLGALGPTNNGRMHIKQIDGILRRTLSVRLPMIGQEDDGELVV